MANSLFPEFVIVTQFSSHNGEVSFYEGLRRDGTSNRYLNSWQSSEEYAKVFFTEAEAQDTLRQEVKHHRAKVVKLGGQYDS